MKLLLGTLLFLLALSFACGDDAIVIFSTNFGTVSGDPDCRAGEFDLHDQQGLTVVVVLTSNSTIILADSSFGTCSDLSDGASVAVRGQEFSGRITATEVRVQ